NHHKKWAIIRASSSRKYIHGTILPTATGKSRCPGEDAAQIAPTECRMPNSSRMEVVIANGRRVVVDQTVDVKALLRIIRGLETL
ncbi:hypothetical protein ACQZ6T_28355, partial [Rhizobium sp. L74/93]